MELLVVITIIVVLLALLTPALDRAIYNAELAVCGARQRAVGSLVTQYAFENQRRYPDRGIHDRERNSAGDGTPDGSGVGYLPVMMLARPTLRYDIRPGLTPFMDINKYLQCPFTTQLELVDTDPDLAIETSYAMFWGWQYKHARGGKGMYKIGDRLEWAAASSQGLRMVRYSLLAADLDLRYPEVTQASHPDRDPGRLILLTSLDELVFTARTRVSRWSEPSVPGDHSRGVLDLNFTTADGAVTRINDVRGWVPVVDERLEQIPLQFDVKRVNTDLLQVPPL